MQWIQLCSFHLWQEARMFNITEKNINHIQSEIIKDPSVGGIVYFQGVVRNHNDGKAVTSLEYDAYIPMANKIGKNIIAKAKEKFNIVDAICLHRIGYLAINDTAVWVITTSHHRKEAYEANQYIIDAIKTEVPIWKKEYYLNESPQWVACHRCNEHSENLKQQHPHHQHHRHNL